MATIIPIPIGREHRGHEVGWIGSPENAARDYWLWPFVVGLLLLVLSSVLAVIISQPSTSLGWWVMPVAEPTPSDYVIPVIVNQIGWLTIVASMLFKKRK